MYPPLGAYDIVFERGRFFIEWMSIQEVMNDPDLSALYGHKYAYPGVDPVTIDEPWMTGGLRCRYGIPEA